MVPWVDLESVIVVFPDHNHLLNVFSTQSIEGYLSVSLTSQQEVEKEILYESSDFIAFNKRIGKK